MIASVSSCRLRFVSFLSVVALVLVFVLLALSQRVAAGSGPLAVLGKVTDVGGSPISGASILVEIVDKTATLTATTNSNGDYYTDPEFSPGDYDVGDKLKVTATSGLGSKTVYHDITSDDESNQMATVNIQYDTAIPEFGSTFGLIVAAFLVGVVAIVVVGRKRT